VGAVVGIENLRLRALDSHWDYNCRVPDTRPGPPQVAGKYD